MQAPTDLVAALATVPDPRARRGIRHRLVTVLALAVCAVLTGARSYVAIAEWAHDLPLGVRIRLGLTVARATPSESAIRRILQKVDPEALDRAVSDWLIARAARTNPPPPDPAQPSAPEQNAGSGTARIAAPPPRVPSPRVIAVDGKSARGARLANERAVHLLAALDTRCGIVLGQSVVDGKTNEVRHEAPCRIPDSVRRNLEDSSWVRWLTRSRKAMGTKACHETGGHVQMPGVMRSGDPRDMAKAGLPEAQSPAMQVFIHRKWRLKPVPRSAPGYLVAGRNLRSAGRCPVRIFKGMSGAPTSRCYVRQGRTWDRLRGASPMATECP